jgi:tRNA pseudouridine55 synthase
MEEFLLIDKPEGWTSFDAVGYIRKMYRKSHPEQKNIKVGHAGTLDPFATGLLIVAVGREATKRIDKFKDLKKEYRATVHLGMISNTDDKTGTLANVSKKEPTLEDVEQVLAAMVGKQEQIPPMFSAKKIDGVRLYKLARKGQEVERKAVPIEIYSIRLIRYSYPLLDIEIVCSSGTYVRTIARTIGEKLQTGAYCEELRRTAIGEYRVEEAKTPQSIEQ